MYIKNYWDFFVTKKSDVEIQEELVIDSNEE
jgi:hypothetical protein